MSLGSTMVTGFSGLRSNGTAINVIGDNIANVNTVGYRKSRAMFEDFLSRSLLGVGEVGGGSRLASIDKIFMQGALVASERSTDMAITGRGFFLLSGSHNGVENNYYSRAGNFNIDKDGFLVTQSGLNVQGWDADISGTIQGALTDLRIEPQSISPNQTSAITVNVNLNSNEAVNTAFSLADPLNTSSHQSSVTIFDSLGNAHDATIYFNKTNDPGAPTPTQWTYSVVVDGEDLTGGVAGAATLISEGTLDFNQQGQLETHTPNPAVLAPNFAGAQPGQAINFDFGDDITGGGTGLQGTTQFASPFELTAVTQDGYASGNLAEIVVGEDGIITGLYSNGVTQSIAQVALADFRDLQGLKRVGGNFFIETPDSGEPLVGFAGLGGRGSIQGNSLEQSNVDLSEEFINLITAQRGFQASGRTITTADELTQETLALKR
jgi:flagellar hook protein FlgE